MSAAPAVLVTPAGQPAAPATPRLEIAALPAVWEMNSNVEWLVDGMIPRCSVNLISAESGTGKTWLAHAIAGAVARGASFIGRTVQRATPVLYFDGENPLLVVKRNLRDLGIAATPNLHIWGGWNAEPPPGPDDDRIIRYATEAKPLLIWDSLVEFAHCDEQSSTDMRKFMNRFRHLAHRGATVIILHHTGKSKASKQYRGSSDIKASVDTAYLVTGKERHGKLHRLTMDPFKSRIAPGQKFTMEFSEGRGFTALATPPQEPRTDPYAIVRRIVRENRLSNGTRIKQLAKTLGVSKGVVDEILKGEEYGFERGQGPEKRYFLQEPVPVPDFPAPGVEELGKLDGATTTPNYQADPVREGVLAPSPQPDNRLAGDTAPVDWKEFWRRRLAEAGNITIEEYWRRRNRDNPTPPIPPVTE
jgi:KaiC/GvpD/RAD55 family RecA-like ATPase